MAETEDGDEANGGGGGGGVWCEERVRASA